MGKSWETGESTLGKLMCGHLPFDTSIKAIKTQQ